MPLLLNGSTLTLDQLFSVVLHHEKVELAPDARARMNASRAVIDKIVESGEVAYGVNTGFGKMASVRISTDQIRQLQTNLVRSHACGVGPPLSESETRAMLLLRANAIAKGFSGIRPIAADVLCAMLNNDVHPLIPSQGSVGASGDLAPLAHLAEVAIGEGRAIYAGREVAGAQAMQSGGITPLTLEAKEGLALLNGTQAMLALLSLSLRAAEILTNTADVATALTLDALRGTPAAFDPRIADVRNFPGARTTAANLIRLSQGSEIRESHRSAKQDPRVQDPYSLRCTPQVHGAVRDSLASIRDTVEIELNSATDNPLVFANPDGSGEVLSGGNFHGQPLAMAADQLAVALTTLAGISERRVDQMTNPLTSGLPAFLIEHAGVNSGFMILQVTAAALTSEMKALSTPHSVDSMTTSGNQEDYVSMGMGAARRLKPMLENLTNILAIELLCAAQGIDLLKPLKTGILAQRAHSLVRSKSPFVSADRSLSSDISSLASLISSSSFSSLLS